MTKKRIRIKLRVGHTATNKMFAQWWGDVLIQSAIFVQRLVTWDNVAFQSPTTAQTQTLGYIASADFRDRILQSSVFPIYLQSR
jgi:hypothetical protein